MIRRTLNGRDRWRPRLAWIGLAVALVLLAATVLRLVRNVHLPVDDFLEYWAAGRLALQHGNPYSPVEMLRLQAQVGLRDTKPVMMWNPPWALPLFMPFGMLSYPLGRVLWAILSFGVLMVCAAWIWRAAGGAPRQRWLVPIVSITFAPALHGIAIGQISPLVLLGLVGFLHFADRGRYWEAGASLFPAAIKPHLLYLLWIALLLWAFQRRRWPVLMGSAAAVLASTAVAVSVNPPLLHQYLEASTWESSRIWITPTIGAVLRLIFGWDRLWLQLVPTIIGAGWSVIYWRRHRMAWQWQEQLPIVVLVSVATTAYGWFFDWVILLLVVLPLLAYLCRNRTPFQLVLALTVYLVVNVLLFLLGDAPNVYTSATVLSGPSQSWDVWMVPLLLLVYLLVRKRMEEGVQVEPRG